MSKTRCDWRQGCYVSRQKHGYYTFTRIIELLYEDISMYNLLFDMDKNKYLMCVNENTERTNKRINQIKEFLKK